MVRSQKISAARQLILQKLIADAKIDIVDPVVRAQDIEAKKAAHADSDCVKSCGAEAAATCAAAAKTACGSEAPKATHAAAHARARSD